MTLYVARLSRRRVRPSRLLTLGVELDRLGSRVQPFPLDLCLVGKAGEGCALGVAGRHGQFDLLADADSPPVQAQSDLVFALILLV